MHRLCMSKYVVDEATQEKYCEIYSHADYTYMYTCIRIYKEYKTQEGSKCNDCRRRLVDVLNVDTSNWTHANFKMPVPVFRQLRKKIG
jgi:hypothetical protein